MEQRRRSHSFHEADTIDGQHPALHKHLSVPASDGETSSFSTDGRSAEDDEFFLNEDPDMPVRTRARSSSIIDEEAETTSSESAGSASFEDFTEDFGEEEPELPRTRSRSRSRYGMEDANILGLSLVGSPPPPPSPMNVSPESQRSAAATVRKGALRDSELKALKAGIEEAVIRPSDRQLEEEEEERRLAEVERAQSTTSVPSFRSLNPAVKKIKLLMLGDSGVGKSSLLFRWVEDTFNVSLVGTIGVDFKVKRVKIGDDEVHIQIWDTAGQQKFHKITTAYYRGAHGILLVYDVTSQKSLQNIAYWMDNIKQHSSNKTNIALIGNKVDMRESSGTRARSISTHDGQQAAANCNVPYFETSAKTGEGVEFAFMSVAHQVIQTLYPEDRAATETGAELSSSLESRRPRKRISEKCIIS